MQRTYDDAFMTLKTLVLKKFATLVSNMQNFKSNFILGTFKSKWDKEAVDFHKAIGVPNEEAEAMNGLETVAKNYQGKDGKMNLEWIVEAASDMNGDMSIEFGKAFNIDSPMFGGKAELTFWLINDNHVIILAKSEGYGTIVFNEQYEEKGIKITYMHKESGKMMIEKWIRI